LLITGCLQTLPQGQQYQQQLCSTAADCASDCAVSCKCITASKHVKMAKSSNLVMFDQAMEILEIQPDLQDVVLNADKKLSVQLRVRDKSAVSHLKTPET
jgi:hypothetical protein